MKVYYKDSCVTCKKVLSEIERMGKDVEKRDLFRDPLSEEELRKIIAASGKKPREMLRKRDKMYRELGIEGGKYSDSQIIRLMSENPGLIMRPIITITAKNKVCVGKAGAAGLLSQL